MVSITALFTECLPALDRRLILDISFHRPALSRIFDEAGSLHLLQNGSLVSANLKATDDTTYKSFFDIYSQTIDIVNEPIGLPETISSRLIPRHYFENDPAGLAKAIRQGQDQAGIESAVLPVQVLIAPPVKVRNSGKTSINPIWYDSLWHVICTGGWGSDTPARLQAAETTAVHNAADVLRKYAPDGGAYQNEADGEFIRSSPLLNQRIESQNILSLILSPSLVPL